MTRTTRLLSLLFIALGSCVDPNTATYNNCSYFKDRSADSALRVVTFGGTIGLNYSPSCMEIAAGQSVSFQGVFGTHPLSPGSGPTATKDGSPNNPITTPAADATEISFTFPTPGQYPYYCAQHVGGGMVGVIKVR